MAELQDTNILRNQKGQSVVEYILLLAVISSLGFAIFNNKKFVAFINGKDGFFTSLRAGMEYSYRYGRSVRSPQAVNVEDAMDFNYQNQKHDTYFNIQDNQSRFFTGQDPYGSAAN